MENKPANPVFEGGRVRITGGDITFYVVNGCLNLTRWVNKLDGKFPGLRYVASIRLNKPGTNTWCGAIDIPTGALGDILPWIPIQTEKVNEQFKLDDAKVIADQLQELEGQFKEFLPTLEAEDRQINDMINRLR